MRLILSLAVGLVSGVAVTFAFIVLGAAVYWLFVFGDDPWPEAAETALVVAASGAGAIAAAGVTLALNRGWEAPPDSRH
jgi:hypothetical protein